MVTGKKPAQIKLQRFWKEWIWTFGWLVHQINPLHDLLKLEKFFQKNKDVIGKTLFSVIGPFCTPLSICLNIGFWQGNFVWKCFVFNLSTFNWKKILQFFEKDLHFSENLFQNLSIENVQNFQWLSHNLPISQTEDYLKNP